MKNYVGAGNTIQYTASGADYSAGDVVVIGNLLGVCAVDIADGETGTVNLTGVYEVPKVDGAVIGKGESLTWDVSAGKFDDNAASPATGDITGAAAVAMEAKGVTSGTASVIKVRFTGAPGTKA